MQRGGEERYREAGKVGGSNSIPLPFALLQVFKVGKILLSARSFFVLFQVFQIDKVYLNILDIDNNPVRVTSLKINPRGRQDDINPVGWIPKLDDHIGLKEIAFLQF